ncbi:fez family zinc finger protein 2-like [Culicoides brevitarsis]|uniref:fez family zinc finger protein 2-like n=1 Tax=Culicoides brevitarsis TaxID=469753 RepID=UPI00307CA0E6
MDEKVFPEGIDQAVSFGTGLIPTPTYITLPISLPGAKLNDAQTVQIQVLNPNLLQQNAFPPKMGLGQLGSLGQIHIPLQTLPSYQNTTEYNSHIITVAYNNDQGEILCQNGFTDDMTVLAAIQPQDLQTSEAIDSTKIVLHESTQNKKNYKKNGGRHKNKDQVNTQQCQLITDPLIFKIEENETAMLDEKQFEEDTKEDPKPLNKIKNKKKLSQNKVNKKPGSVHIATALDGTTLFCCPECQMAYSEKSCLEKHLLLHKIDRRFICDICGAGLKRKEHLERHKLGHNPERPYICTICGKGFKRKEHLNLHVVIHSGNKTEICGECGKGFYRKDHLRKHVKSHISKRIKEQTADIVYSDVSINTIGHFPTTVKVEAQSEPISIVKQLC